MGYDDSRGPTRGGRRGSHDARHRSHEVYRTAPYGSDRGGRTRESRAQPDTEVIEVSSNRLYVYNLAWRVSWQDLKDHFRQAGEVVRSEIFTQGPSGRSKGCGIVEMAFVDDAANAVEKLMVPSVKVHHHGRDTLASVCTSQPNALRWFIAPGKLISLGNCARATTPATR